MSKKFRNWLFYAFIAIFIFLTVVISLYASGYKFNLSWPLKFNRLLQKTGMLNVATIPKNASIFLNGKQVRTNTLSPLKKDLASTPAKIKNLLPGEYTLRLELENYWPFEQKVRIDSGQTTFAEDINLFRSDLPLLLSASEAEKISLSPDKKFLYLENSGRIIRLKDSAESQFSAPAKAAGRWLKSGNQLFAGGQLIDPEKGLIVDALSMVGDGAKIWRYGDDGLIYYSTADSINRLESDNHTSRTIIKAGSLADFDVKNGYVLDIIKLENKTFLQAYSLSDGGKVGEIELPPTGDYYFYPDESDYASIYDRRNSTLYLVTPKKLDGLTQINNIKSWSWLDKNQILYNNDWEISIFDLSSGRSNLITRVNEIISGIIWQPAGNYFIFSTDSSLNATDMKTRNVTPLFSAEHIASPVIDEKNKLIYFYAKIGQQAGIYKTKLQ